MPKPPSANLRASAPPRCRWLPAWALLLLLASLGASEPWPAPLPAGADLDRLPVLHEGRVKPFRVAAEEVLWSVCGRARLATVATATRELEGESWPAAAVLADWMAQPELWRARPLLTVPHPDLQKRLGIPGPWATLAEAATIGPEVATIRRRQMRERSAGTVPEPVPLEHELIALASRAGELEAALRGRAIAIAPLAASEAERAWVEARLDRLAGHGADWRERLLGLDAPVQAVMGQAPRDPKVERALRLAAVWLPAGDLAITPDPLLAEWPGAMAAQARAWGEALKARDAQRLAQASAALAPLVITAARERTARVHAIDPEIPEREVDQGIIDLELTYYRTRPFTWAWIAFLLGGILTSVGLSRAAAAVPGARPALGTLARIGVAASLVGVALWLFGLWVRHTFSGLGAVTNLYETVVFVSGLSAIIGLVFALVLRNATYALAGGIGAALCAMVGEAMPPDLGEHASQLQPVLRSKFWLWVHVKVVVASYAAFVVAWVMGNIQLTMACARRTAVTAAEAQALYRTLQVGTVLIAAGTLLGGVWAAQAWGRFWGWDPKEVYALLVLLIYLIPLHLRYVGVVGPTGLAAWSVFGFLSVVMSWYGVNFLLGAGLHAYAFGDGGQLYVLPLCGVQIIITVTQLILLRRPAIPG